MPPPSKPPRIFTEEEIYGVTTYGLRGQDRVAYYKQTMDMAMLHLGLICKTYKEKVENMDPGELAEELYSIASVAMNNWDNRRGSGFARQPRSRRDCK